MNLEELELSTRLVIDEAKARGLKVEILDAEQNVIRISKEEQTEIVQQATITSLDSAATFQVLGNKWVAKQLMQEAELSTAEAKHYLNVQEATLDWRKWENIPHVIKPTTTNYGIGIHIHSEPPTQEAYEAAIKDAFSKDKTILIETFIPGDEYRFLVIDGKCIAVLKRVPANVKGDGKQTIQELVKEKNSDPRRGKGYKTPLERIELGEIEQSILKEQGLRLDSVPESNQQVFLRHNSNISTGGDSIDYTDQMHDTYKEVAIQASSAAQATICGVDLIVQDPNTAATNKNHGVIEVNYNPVLYFHDYPYEGKNRHTAKAVLDALGF